MGQEVIIILIEASFIGFTTIYAVQDMIFGSDGHVADLWSCSFIIFTTVIIGVNAVILQRTNQISALIILAVLITSIGPFYLFVFAYDQESFAEMNVSAGSWSFCYGQPLFQLVLLINIFWICSTEFIVQLLRREFTPNVADYFRELCYQGMEQTRDKFVNTPKDGWKKKQEFGMKFSYASMRQGTIRDYDHDELEAPKKNDAMPSDKLFRSISHQDDDEPSGSDKKFTQKKVNQSSLVNVEDSGRQKSDHDTMDNRRRSSGVDVGEDGDSRRGMMDVEKGINPAEFDNGAESIDISVSRIGKSVVARDGINGSQRQIKKTGFGTPGEDENELIQKNVIGAEDKLGQN